MDILVIERNNNGEACRAMQLQNRCLVPFLAQIWPLRIRRDPMATAKLLHSNAHNCHHLKGVMVRDERQKIEQRRGRSGFNTNRSLWTMTDTNHRCTCATLSLAATEAL